MTVKTKSTWRLEARAVINQVVADNPDVNHEELSRLISAAYPFGQRKHHPYKCWLLEVRLALGGKKERGNVRDFWTR